MMKNSEPYKDILVLLDDKGNWKVFMYTKEYNSKNKDNESYKITTSNRKIHLALVDT